MPYLKSIQIVRPYIYAAISVIIGLCVATACQNNRQVDADDDTVSEQVQETQVNHEDTVTAIPEKPSITNTEEAEAYLKENSDRYTVGIFPRMAKDNPKYLAKLLDNCEDGFIIVDKGRMKVVLYDSYGREIKEYGMACSKKFGTKHKKGDNRTPEGFFSIEGIYNSTDWLYTDDNGVTSQKKGQFGPRFIRLLIPGTSAIGIHGTCAPWSIGGRVSHGCIRLTNENILDLVERVKPGMPVIVVPGKKDIATNKSEGHNIPWIASTPGQKDPRSEAERIAQTMIDEKEKAEQQDTVVPDVESEEIIIEMPIEESIDTITN